MKAEKVTFILVNRPFKHVPSRPRTSLKQADTIEPASNTSAKQHLSALREQPELKAKLSTLNTDMLSPTQHYLNEHHKTQVGPVLALDHIPELPLVGSQ